MVVPLLVVLRRRLDYWGAKRSPQEYLSSPLSISQHRRVRLSPLESKNRPLGLKAIRETCSLCPMSCWISLLVATSQIMIGREGCPFRHSGPTPVEASSVPSALNTGFQTFLRKPWAGCLVRISHARMTRPFPPPPSPQTRSCPSGLKTRPSTLPLGIAHPSPAQISHLEVARARPDLIQNFLWQEADHRS